MSVEVNLSAADQALLLSELAATRPAPPAFPAGKPAVLLYPGLPGFEAILPEFEIVRPGEQHASVSAAVVAGHKVPNDVIAAYPSIRLVACVGVGLEGVDVDFLHARGITVTNGTGVNQEDVADIAIGLLIGVARRFALGQQVLLAGAWKPWSLAVPPQRRLRGMRMGIVGMGAIGQAIAARAEALGLAIAWHGPRDKPELPYPYVPELATLARDCDVLAVAARGDDSTQHLIDAAIIEALGPRGILINISRGSVVDELALIRALQESRLWGAGLDVFDPEPTSPDRWRDVPNVMLTPHLGGGTLESLVGSLVNMIENLHRHFTDRPLLTPLRR